MVGEVHFGGYEQFFGAEVLRAQVDYPVDLG